MRQHAILTGGWAIVNIYHDLYTDICNRSLIGYYQIVVLTFIIKTEHMRKEDQLMEAYDAPNIEVIEVEVEQVILSSSIDDMGYGENNW